MTRTKTIYLALLAVLLSPMANADSIAISTGDLGNNVIFDSRHFLWEPLLDDPSGSGINDLTVTYGLWNAPSVLFDVIVNGNTVGSLFADNAYISSGPAFFIFDVSGLLIDGINSILFTGNNGNNGDYVIGQVDLTYDSSPASVPEPGTLALLGLGLVGMAARRRKTA